MLSVFTQSNLATFLPLDAFLLSFETFVKNCIVTNDKKLQNECRYVTALISYKRDKSATGYSGAISFHLKIVTEKREMLK